MQQTAQTATYPAILSAQNPRFKAWQKLLDGRGIKKQQEAILSGNKIVREILQLFPERVSGILTRKPSELEEFTPLPNGRQIPVHVLGADLFAQLDIYGTDSPLLLISAPPLPQWDGRIGPGLTLFLPFQNPINLGTTIRSAAALGVPVVLLKEAASPYLPKSLRASGPALFQTQVMQGPGLAELAARRELPVFALSAQGQNIFAFNFPLACGLVAGLEGPGLLGDWAEETLLSIPMRQGVESLNASQAVSMALACRLARIPQR